MNVREKLAYHLEMVIWEDAGEGVQMNARQVAVLVGSASDAQKRRAYERALTKSPILLPDEVAAAEWYIRALYREAARNPATRTYLIP